MYVGLDVENAYEKRKRNYRKYTYNTEISHSMRTSFFGFKV